MDSTSLGQVALHNKVCLSGRICRDMSADLSFFQWVCRAAVHSIFYSRVCLLGRACRTESGSPCMDKG